MRRALAAAFAALLVTACADDAGPRFEYPLDPVADALRLDPNGCTEPERTATAPLTSIASSTRLRNITDARVDPSTLGILYEGSREDPVLLRQDPHDPLDLALGRRLARALAEPQMPELVVADAILQAVYVESRASTVRAELHFSVVPIMLRGRMAPVGFHGSASANDTKATLELSQKALQAAFCDATNKFEAWLAGSPKG